MTVPQHTNSVPTKLNDAEKHIKNYNKEKKIPPISISWAQAGIFQCPL
jgi:hypothetical protein